MPRSRAWPGPRIRTSVPSNAMMPPSGAYTPARILMSVLFPAPFSPSRACTSAAPTEKSTPLRACTPPKRLSMPRMCRRSAIGMPDARAGRVQGPEQVRVGEGLGDQRLDVVQVDQLQEGQAAELAAVHERDAPLGEPEQGALHGHLLDVRIADAGSGVEARAREEHDVGVQRTERRYGRLADEGACGL